MGRITRRGVLGGAVAGALLGVAGNPARLMAASPLRIPERPMRLIRRLERGMRGGTVLMVERQWRVAFVAQGGGFSITGDQISATVDAPRELERLAQLERARSTADMFPILLAPDGKIAAAGQYTRLGDVQDAVKRAESIIRQRAIPGEAKALQMRYLAQLQRASSSLLAHLPSDLFYPEGQPTRAVRPVSLPDGLEGEFEVTYEAHRAEAGQWLGNAERQVITRIGDSERRSREVWTMALA